MRAMTIGGIKVQPKWEWSKEYKKHVQYHTKALMSKEPFKYSNSMVEEHNVFYNETDVWFSTFRKRHSRELAESMVKYALWIVERDGLSLTTHKLVVNLTKGTVRFTVHPDLEGYTVHIPNHDWNPTVIEESIPDLLAA